MGPVTIRLSFAHPWAVCYAECIYQYISNPNQLSEVFPGSTHGNPPVSVSSVLCPMLEMKKLRLRNVNLSKIIVGIGAGPRPGLQSVKAVLCR